MFEALFLRHAAKRLMRGLLREGKILACAESCTGGMLSSLITSLPGSSAVLWGSLIVYSNHAKQELAGVQAATISSFGAVSEQTVAELLAGVLNRYPVDYALAISGIAGPSGGSAEKPVGTVYIGICRRGSPPIIQAYLFKAGRKQVREKSCAQALKLLQAMLDDSLKAGLDNPGKRDV